MSGRRTSPRIRNRAPETERKRLSSNTSNPEEPGLQVPPVRTTRSITQRARSQASVATGLGIKRARSELTKREPEPAEQDPLPSPPETRLPQTETTPLRSSPQESLVEPRASPSTESRTTPPSSLDAAWARWQQAAPRPAHTDPTRSNISPTNLRISPNRDTATASPGRRTSVQSDLFSSPSKVHSSSQLEAPSKDPRTTTPPSRTGLQIEPGTPPRTDATPARRDPNAAAIGRRSLQIEPPLLPRDSRTTTPPGRTSEQLDAPSPIRTSRSSLQHGSSSLSPAKDSRSSRSSLQHGSSSLSPAKEPTPETPLPSISDIRQRRRSRTSADIGRRSATMPSIEMTPDHAKTSGQPETPVTAGLNTTAKSQRLEFKQTEMAYVKGNIFNLVAQGSWNEIEDQINRNLSILKFRGAVGEVPIHMCCIFQKIDLAEKMLARDPDQRVEVYTLKESGKMSPYEGENCLHIAIVNKHHELVKLLLQTRVKEQLDARAVGSFFQRGQPCYYGESPLGFTVCTNQPILVKLLVDAGASLQTKDSYQNSLLHLCVIHGLAEMFDFVLGLIEEQRKVDKDFPDLMLAENVDGLTPLTLAACDGHSMMFTHLVDKSKRVQWQYGPVTCVLYPLEGFDLIPGQRMGAIEHIVEKERIELLTHPRVLNLLELKWNAFGRRHFTSRLFQTLSYLIVFMFVIMLPPADEDGSIVFGTKMVGQGIILFGAANKFIKEILEFKQEGWHGYFGVRGAAFIENFCSLVFSSSILLVALIRVYTFIAGSFGEVPQLSFLPITEQEVEHVLLSVASLSGWGYMLFFAMGYRHTGPFVVMIYHMFVRDISRFSLIYMIFMLGFAQAFYCLGKDVGIFGFLATLKACFYATLGQFDFTGSEERFPILTSILLIVYVVLMSIMLLNLLIAMMGNSFSDLIEKTENIWHLEKARIIFSIEQQMGADEREKEENKYWIVVDKKKFIQVEDANSEHFAKFQSAEANS
eukprot:c19633_g1_i1.p1 GENE.c19633_g1_i1~~c19633_g1_i1.p1  ORF type:complete len:995 (+),score=216.02 c19633_g1_i1:47-2986(+)